MSLDAIRNLRLRGQKPHGVVTVLIGPKPRWLDDDVSIVVIRPQDEPALMDWRPVVGLWVAVFATDATPEAVLAVLDGLKAAGAKLFGFADRSGTHPLVMEAGPRHHRNLRSTWESLCP